MRQLLLTVTIVGGMVALVPQGGQFGVLLSAQSLSAADEDAVAENEVLATLESMAAAFI